MLLYLVRKPVEQILRQPALGRIVHVDRRATASMLVGGAFDLIIRGGDALGEAGQGFGGSGAGVHGVDLIMDRVLPM